jgi:hypothetical protein
VDIEQEIARGIEAKKILESPRFREAHEKVQQDIFDKFASTDPNDKDGMQVQRLRLNVLADILRNLAEVMNSGRLAEAKLEHERSLMQQAKDRLSKGLRRVF